jgi:inosine triphosphate pyrophosphatase
MIGYAKSSKEMYFFEGSVKGKIVSPKGKKGFGWDPIFQPNGEYNNQTFGEMDPYKKNSISHRYLALCKLKDYFINLV